MNALVAPKPAAAALTRWTRPAELLVYLVPVGTISAELYDGYVQLLHRHSVIAIRSLTRPGGYAAELSPFRSFAWDGGGSLRFRFVSTTDKIDSFDGEDVHASARAIGVLGICHCPTTPSLPAAYAQFMDSIRHFPGLLVQKCFAFEHQFDLQTVEECAPLSHLVMFPVYHELNEDDSGGGGGGDGMSTVSLHLEVVLDTMCVTILMSLESTVRAALRQHTQTQTQSLLDLGDAAGFLLDTNVEPSSQSQQHGQPLSPFPSRDSGASPSSSNMRSLPSTPTNDRASAAAGGVSSGGGVASLFVSAEARNRRRLLARQRKLFGDYAVLLSCVPDAIEHYVSAIELLRDEERRSSGAPGDALWLAAALEGYVFCLYQQCQDKFMVEIVEKASEALSLYVKAGVSELEIALVEHIGWYYTAVVVQLSAAKGMDKVEVAVWVKRLLWEVVERGLMVYAELPVPRQVHFLIQSASMLEAVGHHRRMALFLHEAVTVLIQRWRPANGLLSMTSPGSQSTLQPQQRLHELHVALRLENVAAIRLGMTERTNWEVTSLRRRTRRLRRQHKHKSVKVTLAMAAQDVEPWLILRFHVLRQLITIAKMLPDPLLVGKYCIQLLQVLSWCDEIAAATGDNVSIVAVDQSQAPFTSSAGLRSAFGAVSRLGLHTRASGGGGNNNSAFSGVYGTPPASIEVKTKRYFSMANSPSATMSSAAATITSTIANTPRTLLATPRQQLSAAVNAISTKASPSFSSFSNHHHSSPSSVSSLASTPSSSLPSRSSSATAAELLNGVGSGATANGATRNSFTDGDQLKLDAIAAGMNGASAALSHESLGSQSLVWDLRSRAEVQRLQRRVLGILESECVVMRPTEQVKLGSFVRVHKMRVLFDLNRHPLMKKDVALKKCGVSSSRDSASAAGGASPAFFYNPFDKSKSSDANQKTSRPQNESSDSEDGSDNETSPGESEYERCFPAHERVRVEVVLSNPIGVELDLQQVIVWISATQQGSDPLTTPASAAIEAYPSTVVLKAYEKRKRVVLAMRALRAGSFNIVGCFVKVLNIKTSFSLPKAQPLSIVDALPILSVSLAEIGSLSEETPTETTSSTSSKEGGDAEDVAVSKAITDPICMFANETKRCVLHVRNTSQRPVRSFHVMLRAGKASASLARGQARTVFSSLGGDHQLATDELLHFETEGVTFKCLVSAETLAALLPLQHGDQLAIPFEVSLRMPTTPALSNSTESRRDQLQWTLLYSADSDPVSAATEANSEYFRESQHVVTLVSLGSLLLNSVQIISKSSTATSHSAGPQCDDHDHCLVVVEVVNPTETVFVLRLRETLACRDSDVSSSGWDIEIGRRSSRCLLIELPRVEASSISSLAETLNSRLELQWKTYFGTKGRLYFHDSIWTDSAAVKMSKHLCRPEVHTVIEAVSGLEAAHSSRVDDGAAGQNHVEPGFPFRFYHPANAVESDTAASVLVARLFESCVVEFTVRLRRGSDFKAVQAQIVMRRGGDADEREFSSVSEREIGHDLSDAVLLSGQTTRLLEVSAADSAAGGTCFEWRWRVACVFLSEGSFEVTVRCAGASTPNDEDEASAQADGDDVWCHRPLRIQSVR